MDYYAVRKAFARALIGGAHRHSLSHAEWDVSGNCSERVYQDLHAHPPTRSGTVCVDRKSQTPFRLELWVRCRRCDNCLSHRARQWTAKAVHESRNSIRTWFGTLTLRPEAQYSTLAEARKRYAPNGDLDGIGYDAQFAKHTDVIGEDLTRYIKRIRKQSKAKLRYLLVAEHHKSGLPHYHALVHEHDLIGVNHDILRDQWKLGFTKWRLVDNAREAAYACKYLSKSKASRIRASLMYGNTSLDIALAFGTAATAARPTGRDKTDPQLRNDLRAIARHNKVVSSDQEERRDPSN